MICIENSCAIWIIVTLGAWSLYWRTLTNHGLHQSRAPSRPRPNSNRPGCMDASLYLGKLFCVVAQSLRLAEAMYCAWWVRHWCFNQKHFTGSSSIVTLFDVASSHQTSISSIRSLPIAGAGSLFFLPRVGFVSSSMMVPSRSLAMPTCRQHHRIEPVLWILSDQALTCPQVLRF